MNKKGQGSLVRYAVADSPLGRLLVARTDQGICAVALGDSDVSLLHELASRYPAAEITPAGDGLREEIAAVLGQLGPTPAPLHLTFDTAGTAFEQEVWAAMRRIRRGTTVTYGEFASSLNRPSALRAVGAAIGKNPIALLFPCHRVLAQHGALHRYRWGLGRKQLLLEWEGVRFPAPAAAQGELDLGPRNAD